jgi:hypothetical protein
MTYQELPNYDNLNSNMETLAGLLVYQAKIKSIRDYYAAFRSASDIF